MVQESPSDHAKVVGLLLVLLLVGAALLVIRQLHNSSQTEDCFMQGRSDCNPVIGRSE